MKLGICTTTINKPTEAILKFLDMAGRHKGWFVVIAGDLKTPHQDYLDLEKKWPGKLFYLHPLDQEKMSFKLSELIGWNCIQRRNFSYIFACKQGAEVIATIDDDNIPYAHWGEEISVGKDTEITLFETKDEVFDPLSVTNEKHLWHRGFPIELLKTKNNSVIQNVVRRIPLVQADLWNGDPDIDAVCRISFHPEALFNENGHMKGYMATKPSPFNSQNTFISRKLFPDYFLFPHIGRMDDIWASYYVQEKYKGCVMYKRPSVYQKRNPHNLAKDLEQELLGYKHNLEIAKNGVLRYLPKRSMLAFEEYRKLFPEPVGTHQGK